MLGSVKTTKRLALALLIGASTLAALPAQAAMPISKRSPTAALKTRPQPPAPPTRPDFTAIEQQHAVVAGFPDARFFGDSNIAFLNAVPLADGPWLALSGGGEEGAFGAGLLAGLTAAGKRPNFALVTGSSTGALIAPYAFLGARYDEMLKKSYTTITSADVFEIAMTPESLLDTWPLKKLIEQRVTAGLLTEIAAEHRKGRRLFVVTTNLDAGRPVVWDMGAIAVRGGSKALKLFRSVLLASASIPGFFPPVHIEVEANGRTFLEMHADGSIRAPFYVAPEGVLAGANARLPASEIYVIVNSRLATGFEQPGRNMAAILGRSISLVMKATLRNDVMRAYQGALRQGTEFRLAVIAPEFKEQGRGVFDPDYMQALFAQGLKQGMGAEPFLSQPPGMPHDVTALRPSMPAR